MRSAAQTGSTINLFHLLVILMALSPAIAAKAAQRQVDFSNDPGWESYRSRLVPDPPPVTRQHFGYRMMRNAGGRAAGEIGGGVQRSSTPAWYAKVIEPKTLNDHLSASGRFSVTHDDNGNGVLFGWFNTDSHGWRTDNSLVFRLDGNGGKYWVFYEYGTRHWLTGGGGCFEGDAYQRTKTKPLLSDGTPHDWSLTYDPDAAGGKGLVTFVLDGKPYELPLAPGYKQDGAVFNRFGILNQQTTGGTIEAYFDDVVIDGHRESFDDDPKWEAKGNEVEFADRVRRPFHDFGFSPDTAHAGGKPGEIGGLVWRDPRGAWYADRVGPLSLKEDLYAEGRIAFTGAGSDSSVLFGWFDATTRREDGQNARRVARSRNVLGVAIEGPSRIGHYFRPTYSTSAGENALADDGPILRPDGTPHRWRIRYVAPKENAPARITACLDDQQRSLEIPARQLEQGATFDRFGIFTYPAKGNHVFLFLDDVSYTHATPEAAPLMAVLDRFTAPDVPALGPAEAEVKPLTGKPQPPGLPGKGMAQHPMLYIGEGYNQILLVNGGKIVWTYSTGSGWEYDDVWMLSNGNVLFTRMQYVAEVTPAKQVVWRYDAPKGTEIHACQPIGLDKVLFVQNGTPPKLLVKNIKTNATEVEHDLPYDPKAGVHAQFRRVRYTARGTYLVPFLLMNQVIEYDKDFKEVWKYAVKSPWAAIRLKNGNTLITDEKDVTTLEVNPAGQTVWQLKPTDLPNGLRFNGSQSCTRLANGNTIICSRGGGDFPQLIEVTRDKKVAWVLKDYAHFGPATAVQVLDEPSIPEKPGESEH